MGVMIATLWAGSPAYAEEERMTTTTKSYALRSVLTYDDVRAVSHRDAVSLRVGYEQRCKTQRTVRDHHTHGVLFRLGDCLSAVAVAKGIFHQRGIGIDQLPPAKDELLPLNEEAERQRATQVSANFGATSPGLVQNTTDLLFRDLWLRPALAPRDRSLVTVSALIASGQVAQITYHLGRAMDNGLTQGQASEVLTHIAFYAD